MRFMIYRTSDVRREFPPSQNAQLVGEEWQFGHKWSNWEIEINTLEELIALRDEVDQDVIVGKQQDGVDFIEIYDDHHA